MQSSWLALVRFVTKTSRDLSQDLKLSEEDSEILARDLAVAVGQLELQTGRSSELPARPVDEVLRQPAARNSRWSYIWVSKSVRDAFEFAWEMFEHPELAPLEAPEESIRALANVVQADETRWTVEWSRTDERDRVMFRRDPGIGYLLDHPRTNSSLPDAPSGSIIVVKIMTGVAVRRLFRAAPRPSPKSLLDETGVC
jgi:hypothetical protein